MDAMRACIRCGCYEPFQDITDECCFQRHGTSCVFLKPEKAVNKKTENGPPASEDSKEKEVGERSAPESKNQKPIKEDNTRPQEEEV